MKKRDLKNRYVRAALLAAVTVSLALSGCAGGGTGSTTALTIFYINVFIIFIIFFIITFISYLNNFFVILFKNTINIFLFYSMYISF